MAISSSSSQDKHVKNEEPSSQNFDSELLDIEDEELAQQRVVSGFSWAIVVISIISSTFLYALDNTVMANIRPGIIKSFGHIEMLQWISVAYPLGEVGSCPFWGAMYQRFNNKWLYIFTVAMFEVGSAIIGSAHSMNGVIAGRVIAGIGGSGIYNGTMNIISVMTTSSERAQYLGYIGIAWSSGTILGPIIGGAFNDSGATWRWAFYINICVAALAAPACVILIPSQPPNSPIKGQDRFKSLDYVGALLFAGGIACVIMILSFGGSIWSWSSGRMIGLYVSAAFIWVVFVLQQLTSIFATQRIFPVEFVLDWEMCIQFCQSAIAISNIVVTISTVPLYFQFVYGYSSLRSGLFIFAVSAAAICAAGGGGAIFPRFTKYKFWFALANMLSLIGSALLTTISSSSTRAVVCGYATLQLVGCGLIVQLPFTVAQVKVPKSKIRAVTGFLTIAQMTGVAFSIGISTCIFVTKAVADLSSVLPSVSRNSLYAGLGGASSSLVEDLPLSTRLQVLQVIAKAVARVFFLNVASSGLGFLLSLAMRWESLKL